MTQKNNDVAVKPKPAFMRASKKDGQRKPSLRSEIAARREEQKLADYVLGRQLYASLQVGGPDGVW